MAGSSSTSRSLSQWQVLGWKIRMIPSTGITRRSKSIGMTLPLATTVPRQASRQERQKVIESQQRMSSDKVDAARLAKETKMLDVYEKLKLADTSLLDEESKAARVRALASMELILFPKGD
ncbi:uncharacterized protein LOC112271929 [Brachypodium distachyon]|uniref:uncharacterized protein LOC112271929 n=1 Tax=Brachypodium distachyon TaxID=15368 RepID=UPI000D0E23BC|nr:uncharacterized protein LOC112271929 [Brachypodium distachyon]|eukprot:XP_024317959.1 uncharacterized protein LOC112271929 [Brachypodium distachyon]